MLVLSRKTGERIVIAAQITVEVLEVLGNRVRLGFRAPDGVRIVRHELLPRAAEDTQRAGHGSVSGDTFPCPCL
jgi:carbon storage regulator